MALSAATTPSNLAISASELHEANSAQYWPRAELGSTDWTSVSAALPVPARGPSSAAHVLLQGHGDIVAELQVYEPNECALEVARICALVEIGLRFD